MIKNDLNVDQQLHVYIKSLNTGVTQRPMATKIWPGGWCRGADRWRSGHIFPIPALTPKNIFVTHLVNLVSSWNIFCSAVLSWVKYYCHGVWSHSDNISEPRTRLPLLSNVSRGHFSYSWILKEIRRCYYRKIMSWSSENFNNTSIVI